MNGKQLKNSILQWAIQGKLVPQDPNDEPASVLLERIRAEKKRLIKEGKIKKDKHESIIYRGDDNSYYEKFADGTVKCIDEEIPFELPQGWSWARFSQLYWQLTDGAHLTPKYTEKGIPFISVKDMSSGQLSFSNTKYISEEEHKILSMRCNPQKGDLLLSKVGTTGVPAIVKTDEPFSLFVSVALIKFFPEFLNSAFLVLLINSPLVQEQARENTRGVGNKNWVLSAIASTLMVIPPLMEQERIVKMVELLNPSLLRYEYSQTRLDALNASIRERIKKSILQEAIQGKLVPQNEDEGTAAELINRVQSEKRRLLKEGKLKKKDITDSIIYKGEDNKYYESVSGKVKDISEEITFDIPDSWRWSRIKTLFQTTSGGTPGKGHPEYYGGDIPWVKVGDLTSLYLSKASETISKLGLENSSAKVFPAGTILVAMYCNDAIGKSTILSSPMATNQAICGLLPNNQLYKEYVYYAIQFNRGRLQEQAAGGAQKNINQKIVNELLIPIPPYKEQIRIVQRIHELYAHL